MKNCVMSKISYFLFCPFYYRLIQITLYVQDFNVQLCDLLNLKPLLWEVATRDARQFSGLRLTNLPSYHVIVLPLLSYFSPVVYDYVKARQMKGIVFGT